MPSRDLPPKQGPRLADAPSPRRVIFPIVGVSSIGLGMSGLLVAVDLPHNARPLLAFTWCSFTAALTGALWVLELGIGRAAGGVPVVATIARRVVLSVICVGALSFVSALLSILGSRPDPALYRVPSLLGAVRAAHASLPVGSHVRLAEVTSLPGLSAVSLDRAWHVRFTTDVVPTRSIDVVVDARSGEIYRLPWACNKDCPRSRRRR